WPLELPLEWPFEWPLEWPLEWPFDWPFVAAPLGLTNAVPFSSRSISRSPYPLAPSRSARRAGDAMGSIDGRGGALPEVAAAPYAAGPRTPPRNAGMPQLNPKPAAGR